MKKSNDAQKFDDAMELLRVHRRCLGAACDHSLTAITKAKRLEAASTKPMLDLLRF